MSIRSDNQLVEGLVGTKHLDLWHNSPHFHAGIRALVQLLPLWVDGLAADAREKQQQHHDQYMRRLMAVPEPMIDRASVRRLFPEADGDGNG